MSAKDPGSEAELIGAGADAFADKAKKGASGGASKALAPYAPVDAGAKAAWPSKLPILIAALGLTAAAGFLLRSPTSVELKPQAQAESPAPAAPLQTAIVDSPALAPSTKDELSRLSEEVKSLRAQNDDLRNTLDRSSRIVLDEARGANSVAAQSAARINKLEERLSRLEKGVDKAPTGAIPTRPAEPAEAATPAAPKSDAAPAPTAKATESSALRERFRLRGVEDGVALIERKDGRFDEVEPGDYLPGAGRVLSIGRRGRDWVVVTTKGVIDRR